jgi:hypothetical protein
MPQAGFIFLAGEGQGECCVQAEGGSPSTTQDPFVLAEGWSPSKAFGRKTRGCLSLAGCHLLCSGGRCESFESAGRVAQAEGSSPSKAGRLKTRASGGALARGVSPLKACHRIPCAFAREGGFRRSPMLNIVLDGRGSFRRPPLLNAVLNGRG